MINSRLEQTINHLGNLIAFPTESAQTNLKLIDYIVDIAKTNKAQISLSYDKHKNKANVLLTMPSHHGSVEGGILLSGHTDVVPVAGQNWSTDPYSMEKKDGKLYGRGSCDMKGFIASCLTMMPAFAATKLREPLHFAFSYDEEVGCLGAQVLAQQMRSIDFTPRIAIIGEPTNMQVIEAHKGVYAYTTEFIGLAGHSSMPEKAISSVEYAVLYAHKLLGLRQYLRDHKPVDSRFDPPYTTIQIGVFRGGIACNVVADQCELEWEMRPVHTGDSIYVNAQMDDYSDQLNKQMQAVYKDSMIRKTVVAEVAGLTPMSDKQARDLVCKLTGHPQVGVVSYGTEAGIFQALGTDCVVCGPGSIEQAHKADEYVAIEQIDQCLQMLHKLQRKIRL